jgi:hypothetical protein
LSGFSANCSFELFALFVLLLVSDYLRLSEVDPTINKYDEWSGF